VVLFCHSSLRLDVSCIVKNEATASACFSLACAPGSLVITFFCWFWQRISNMYEMSVPRGFYWWSSAGRQSAIEHKCTREMVATHLFELDKMEGRREATKTGRPDSNAAAHA
jgi:hypothetical protein